jgi:hypothetical protein
VKDRVAAQIVQEVLFCKFPFGGVSVSTPQTARGWTRPPLQTLQDKSLGLLSRRRRSNPKGVSVFHRRWRAARASPLHRPRCVRRGSVRGPLRVSPARILRRAALTHSAAPLAGPGLGCAAQGGHGDGRHLGQHRHQPGGGGARAWGSVRDANISLGDTKSSLGDANISLGDTKSSLGDANISLGDTKSSLGDPNISLGDTKSSLGDTKSSLGDANISLGDTKSSLGDAESSLGDAYLSLGSRYAFAG